MEQSAFASYPTSLLLEGRAKHKERGNTNVSKSPRARYTANLFCVNLLAFLSSRSTTQGKISPPNDDRSFVVLELKERDSPNFESRSIIATKDFDSRKQSSTKALIPRCSLPHLAQSSTL